MGIKVEHRKACERQRAFSDGSVYFAQGVAMIVYDVATERPTSPTLPRSHGSFHNGHIL